MASVLSVALVIALGGALPIASTAAVPGPSWMDWVMQLRMQLDQIGQVIANIREALVTSITGWWRDDLSKVTHALALTDLQAVLDTLTATMAQLPAELRTNLGMLVNSVLEQTVPQWNTRSTVDSFRVAVAVDPRLREIERRSLGRQVTTASLVALSETVQQSTDQVAATLARSSTAVETAQQAMINAQTLQSSVAGAQSSRALLQYLGEGLADLMRQQAAVGGILSQHLVALSQQDALTTRDLQLVVSLLAQEALAQEQARRGQVAASQEGLRLLAEGYSQSLLAVGTSLLDLNSGSQDRRRRLLDAISPTR